MTVESYYYPELLTAFIRGRLPDLPAHASLERLIELGDAAGLRMHKFKRNIELPRVRQVIGMLRGLVPAELLDIGSGRGTFLWPLLVALPELPVTAIDRSSQRATDLQAVTAGGIDRLTGVEGDVGHLPFADREFDGATILEVLEHLPEPHLGMAEVLRVTRRFVIASVPSKPDENPEHLQLFDADSLTALMQAGGEIAGVSVTVRCQYVANHLIALAQVQRPC